MIISFPPSSHASPQGDPTLLNYSLGFVVAKPGNEAFPTTASHLMMDNNLSGGNKHKITETWSQQGMQYTEPGPARHTMLSIRDSFNTICQGLGVRDATSSYTNSIQLALPYCC